MDICYNLHRNPLYTQKLIINEICPNLNFVFSNKLNTKNDKYDKDDLQFVIWMSLFFIIFFVIIEQYFYYKNNLIPFTSMLYYKLNICMYYLKINKFVNINFCKDLVCPICLDHFNYPVITNCKHIYCAECIRIYLCQSTNCPLCRNDINDVSKVRFKKIETNNI